MNPRGLLVAYEEHGHVLPVASDFDAFLIASKGLEYPEIAGDQARDPTHATPPNTPHDANAMARMHSFLGRRAVSPLRMRPTSHACRPGSWLCVLLRCPLSSP